MPKVWRVCFDSKAQPPENIQFFLNFVFAKMREDA